MPPEPPDSPRRNHDSVSRSFEWIENFIYVVLGGLLGVIAMVYLTYSAVDFVVKLQLTHFTISIVTLLGRLLLVLLIVELLYTVQVSYTRGTLVPEPFLYVGLIAAIRRIFVITAQFAEVNKAHEINFNHFVIELGALSGLILVLAIAIWLLRRNDSYISTHD